MNPVPRRWRGWAPAWRALLVSLALLACPAQAADPQWTGKATTLVGTPVGQGDGRSLRATLEPGVKWRHGEALTFRAQVRMRWLEQEGLARRDFDVRNATASWRGEQSTLTVGAQQIDWGRMDIVRVTDVINPIDQNDLFHEDLSDAKLALWMVDWEWQRDGRNVQLVVTPQPSVDRLQRRIQGVPVQVDDPGVSARNATIAGRFGFEAADWNVDLLAIRGWRSAPILRPVVDPAGVRLAGTPARQHGIGFSADRPFGSTVLRLEGLWARWNPVQRGRASDAQRTATLGAGLDLTAGPWFVAGQVIGARALGTGSDAAGTRNQAFVSAIVQRKWLQDRFTSRLTAIRETSGSSSWVSLQLQYELSPNHLLRLQGDLFRGDPTTAFGAFQGRSRVAWAVTSQL